MIPAGEYAIGHGSGDSRPITVRLSAYYVAESEATFREVGLFLKDPDGHRRFAHERARRAAFVPDRASATTEAQRLCIDIFDIILSYHSLGVQGSLPLRVLDSREMVEQQRALSVLVDSVGAIVGTNADDGDMARRLSVLLADAKTFAAACDRRVEMAVASAPDVPFGRLTADEADALAAWLGGALPTESQWEVAAGLVVKQEAFLSGMFAHGYEWCRDEYVSDRAGIDLGGLDAYWAGPPRLTERQLLDARNSSPFPLRQPTSARVLRGESVSARGFGLPGQPFGPGRAARVVFQRQ